ncbi:DNA primase [Candidatus Magnetominusculus dajiuhuensis]|uniref:DNA primase n=1 Tax=Candidatus Magnetominusculus dajiuhuensis TaxID=3137712 RepID=UPI003B438179
MDFQGIREEIKSRIDIVDVVSDYVGLKKSGARFKGLCPFHAEKTPSFVVSPEKQVFYCFGCGTGGDIITFVMKEEGISYNEAIRKLSERAGIKLEPVHKQNIQEREVLLQIHKAAAAFFKGQLRKSEKALKYLNARGIAKESIEKFAIGAAPEGWDGLLRHLRKDGFQDRHLRVSGLVTFKENSSFDFHRDRIMFPILNSAGDIVAFGGRAMEKDVEPKYLNSPETLIFQKKRILFGLSAAKDGITGAINIVEGYVDVVMCHQYGFTNTVAPLGTALTEEHTKSLKRFAKEAVVIFDGDDAGIRAAKRAMPVILKSGLLAMALLLPEKNDPDSYLRLHGAGDFKELIAGANSYVEFMLKTGGYGVDNLREIYDTLAGIEDTVLRATLVEELSNKASISGHELREKFRGKGHKPTSPGRTIRPRVKKRPEEEMLLRIYLSVPDMAGMFTPLMEMELLEDELIKRIFGELLNGNISPTIEGLSTICTEEEIAYVTGLMVYSLDQMDGEESIEKKIRDCVKSLKLSWVNKKLGEIKEKIKKAELANNPEEVILLSQENIKYLNERRSLS